MTREQYDVAVTQETRTFTAAETEAAGSGYPGGMPPFRQSECRRPVPVFVLRYLPWRPVLDNPGDEYLVV